MCIHRCLLFIDVASGGGGGGRFWRERGRADSHAWTWTRGWPHTKSEWPHFLLLMSPFSSARIDTLYVCSRSLISWILCMAPLTSAASYNHAQSKILQHRWVFSSGIKVEQTTAEAQSRLISQVIKFCSGSPLLTLQIVITLRRPNENPLVLSFKPAAARCLLTITGN